MSSERRGVGRPRDASIDERVIAATRELLVEGGFEAATIQGIAARSGVHTSAIYRRWPSRLEIVEQVAFPGLDDVVVEPTGDLHADLTRFVRAYLTTLGAPAARAAIPALLAAYQGAVPRRSPEQWLSNSARPQLAAIVRASTDAKRMTAGELDDVFDVLLGAILARVLIPTVFRRRRSIGRLVDLVERLLTDVR